MGCRSATAAQSRLCFSWLGGKIQQGFSETLLSEVAGRRSNRATPTRFGRGSVAGDPENVPSFQVALTGLAWPLESGFAVVDNVLTSEVVKVQSPYMFALAFPDALQPCLFFCICLNFMVKVLW